MSDFAIALVLVVVGIFILFAAGFSIGFLINMLRSRGHNG